MVVGILYFPIGSKGNFSWANCQLFNFGRVSSKHLWTPTTHGKMKVLHPKIWVINVITPKNEGFGYPVSMLYFFFHSWVLTSGVFSSISLENRNGQPQHKRQPQHRRAKFKKRGYMLWIYPPHPPGMAVGGYVSSIPKNP